MRVWILTTLVLLFAGSAWAEESLGQRIDVAGQQRMLSQRIARAACFISIDVDVATHRQILSDSVAQFQTSLVHLTDGGGAFDLPPETDRRAKLRLRKMSMAWKSFGALLPPLLSDAPLPDGHIERLSELSNDLLTESNNLVSALEKRARDAGDSIDPQIAKLVNVSGRQRMLIQKVGKEACLLQSRRAQSADARDTSDLLTAMGLFEASAFGLSFGSTLLEIPVPPTLDLETDGFLNWQVWVLLSSTLSVVDETALTSQELSELALELEIFMKDLDKTTERYAVLTPDVLQN